MKFSSRALIAAITLAAAASAHAQAAQATQKLRGVIIDGSANSLTLTLTSDEDPVTVAMPAKVAIRMVSMASLSDIKPDSYVGTAAMRRPGGTLEALEVHIFAASLRGSGEGFRPWEGADGVVGTMTNGTVSTANGGSAGNMVNGTVDNASGSQGGGTTLVVTYKGGQQKVLVPPYAPVVYMAPGDRSQLKSGESVVVVASRDKQGKLTARSVIAGVDGVVPPM